MIFETSYDDFGEDDEFGEGNIPPDLRSSDLPSKRLLGKGLASIGYETEWKGVRYARKDFVAVLSDIFRQEAGILLKLPDHENVVKTHGLTVDKLSCSLVLDYMDDKLTDLLQKRKDLQESSPVGEHDLTLQESLGWILQIARGVEHLHKHGILHGDLKSRNILVNYMDNGDKSLSVKTVKVADFGLVQTKRYSMPYVSHQARIYQLDMVRWKAPEILREATALDPDIDTDEDFTGSACATHSDDAYCFGLTCFQILTGEEPYPKRNWKELVTDIVSNKRGLKLPPNFSCPQELRELVDVCCDADPDKRPTFSYIRETMEHIHSRHPKIEGSAPDDALSSYLDMDPASVEIKDLVRMPEEQRRARNLPGEAVDLVVRRDIALELGFDGGVIGLEYADYFILPEELVVHRQISRGGDAVVYKVDWKGTPCALKVLQLPHSDYDWGAYLPFLKKLPTLIHENIVRFLGYSFTRSEEGEGRLPSILMELLGSDLQQFVHDSRYFPPPEQSEWKAMKGIAEGMKYLHGRDMVHGDLKPGHVLVKGTHEVPFDVDTVKLTDFCLIPPDVPMYTTRYAAPEVLQARRDRHLWGEIDHKKADVYSFAITCSDILGRDEDYGKYPGVRNFKEQVISGILRPALPVDTSQGLQDLITRCWHSKPTERPSFGDICEFFSQPMPGHIKMIYPLVNQCRLM